MKWKETCFAAIIYSYRRGESSGSISSAAAVESCRMLRSHILNALASNIDQSIVEELCGEPCCPSLRLRPRTLTVRADS